jgi:excinuclease ABC subunit C
MNELQLKLHQIPELPGIYKMLDVRGNIIYIGKSICLKKRVRSYFYTAPKWEKVTRMVSHIRDIEYIVTDTHLEARMLECELIKLHKPTFNSQMKNDRRYVYLQIEEYNLNNALAIVDDRSNDTYGPFRRKYYLENFIGLMKNLYPILWKDEAFYFEYHIFPQTMNKVDFNANREALRHILNNGKMMDHFILQLENNMKEAASQYKYETATIYRDLMKGLQYIRYGIDGYHKLFSQDILLRIPTSNGTKLFFVSYGHIVLAETHCKVTKTVINRFVKKGSTLLTTIPEPLDEKSQIDYRDILYSEINSLSEDMVLFLSSN